MKVTVFHKNHEDNSYARVAVVTYNATDEKALCEYAYRWTQNINDSWSHPMGVEDKNDDVEVVGELPTIDGKTYGIRSSMMGDRFYVENGGVYDCAAFGFTKVEERPEEDAEAIAEALCEVEDNDPNGGWSDEIMAIMGKEIVEEAAVKKPTPARRGSKKALVAKIIEEIGLDDRPALIERIVKALGVTKANAGVYIYNYKKDQ